MTPCQVAFFDDAYSGRAQSWTAALPNGGTSGCSACVDLVSHSGLLQQAYLDLLIGPAKQLLGCSATHGMHFGIPFAALLH